MYVYDEDSERIFSVARSSISDILYHYITWSRAMTHFRGKTSVDKNQIEGKRRFLTGGSDERSISLTAAK